MNAKIDTLKKTKHAT